MLSLLRRERTFRWLLVAKTTSFAGDSVLLLALPYFLFVRTGQVVPAAAVFIFAAVPNALLGPWLGALADRVEPRRLLIGCDLLSAVASASLVWIADGRNGWLVYPVVFVLVSCGQTVSFTRGAVTPRIVPEQDLLTANSAESAALSLVRLVAPPLGGLLYAVVGLRWLVLFNAATFVLSATCVALLRLPARAEAARASAGRRGALRRARQMLHPSGLTGRLVWITGGYFLIGQASVILFIPFVRTHFHGSALGVGLLSGCGAIGALAGATASGRVRERLGPLPALAGVLVVEGLARLTFTAMPSLVTAALAVGVSGAAATVFIALLQTTLQQSVAADYVGRLFGLTWSIAGFATIAGMLLFTGETGYLSPVRILQQSAGLCIVLGLCALVVLRRLDVQPTVVAATED